MMFLTLILTTRLFEGPNYYGKFVDKGRVQKKKIQKSDIIQKGRVGWTPKTIFLEGMNKWHYDRVGLENSLMSLLIYLIVS